MLDIPNRARGLVIMLHGFKGFKEWSFFPWLSEQLSHVRIATCRFDFSGSGIGEVEEEFGRLDLFANDTYSAQLEDLRAVDGYLTGLDEIGDLPRSIFGHSRGAAIAILGAAQCAGIRSVGTWSGIATADRWDEPTKEIWRRGGRLEVTNGRTGQSMPLSTRLLDDYEANRDRLDILAAASTLELPLLVVHGDTDETVNVNEGRQLSQAAPNSNFVMIGGASHTFGAIHPLIHVSNELQMAAEVTTRFFATHC